MAIRSKFRLTSVVSTEYSPGYVSKKYVFDTQYDSTIPEDQRFCTATPNGRIEMLIDNPVAQAAFEVGKDYYFDAIPMAAK
jgi:hypothetical protein